MTFETKANLTAQDVVAYALDGLVTLLCNESSVVASGPGIAAMIDVIRQKLDEVWAMPEGLKRRTPYNDARLQAATNVSQQMFEREFVRVASSENADVIYDVKTALDAFCGLIGDFDERPIMGREVWAIANVIRQRLDAFVEGKDLDEALGTVSASSALASATA